MMYIITLSFHRVYTLLNILCKTKMTASRRGVSFPHIWTGEAGVFVVVDGAGTSRLEQLRNYSTFNLCISLTIVS